MSELVSKRVGVFVGLVSECVCVGGRASACACWSSGTLEVLTSSLQTA